MKYLTVTMIENRMICPQMMSAIAEFCKGDKDLKHQSMMCGPCSTWTVKVIPLAIATYFVYCNNINMCTVL